MFEEMDFTIEPSMEIPTEIFAENLMENLQTMPQQKAQAAAPPKVESSQPSTSEASSQKAATDCPQAITKEKLQQLIKEVDPTLQIEGEIEDLLLQLADEFIVATMDAACQFAKHRHASAVDVKDVQLYLENERRMWMPGFGTDEIRPHKRTAVVEAHKQRMGLIRKTIKKS